MTSGADGTGNSPPVDFHAHDLLMVLCTLIVEGRVPTPNDKGRKEGPHVAQLLKLAIAGEFHNKQNCDFYCRLSND